MNRKTKTTRKPQDSAKASSARARAEASRYLMNTYKRPDIVFTHGKGCYLYDSNGRKYLDFLGGIAVNALGYSHPRLVRVIQREAARAIHLSNLFHNSFQGPLARKLADWSGMSRAFFTNSGTEAIEGALKLARAYAAQHVQPGAAKKTRFLALENSFHGRTFGAVSITYPVKYREPFAPLVDGVEFVRFNDVADLEAKFDSTVCAIAVEAIQGEGGIAAVSEPFWNRARQLTSQNQAALIADEIQCGLGRSGRRFAYQKFGRADLPDIVAVAKPLAGGLPLGAVLASDEFAGAFSPGIHGTTFGGGPLACATALEVLNIIEDGDLIENVRKRGAQLRDGLADLKKQVDFIREVRGEGLIVGLDLTVDGTPFVEEGLNSGVIFNCTHGHILRFLPPFIVSARAVDDFLSRLEVILKKTNRAQPISATKPSPDTELLPVARAATR
jgi:acetylornithine/N-succinyldiaminopimelate aminotransferase